MCEKVKGDGCRVQWFTCHTRMHIAWLIRPHAHTHTPTHAHARNVRVKSRPVVCIVHTLLSLLGVGGRTWSPCPDSGVPQATNLSSCLARRSFGNSWRAPLAPLACDLAAIQRCRNVQATFYWLTKPIYSASVSDTMDSIADSPIHGFSFRPYPHVVGALMLNRCIVQNKTFPPSHNWLKFEAPDRVNRPA